MPDESSHTISDPSDPWLGQSFAGYTILRRLGEGGMGVIYVARHESLDRLAAVKFLPAEMAGDVVFVELFLREAKAAAKLSHPNIVDVHDAGSLGEGIYYFIMEFVEGRNLLSILEEKGRLPLHEALDYVQQAASALAYAHKKKLIHRDIKPENMLLTNEGTVKVVDLGLAKWAGQESSMMTQTGDTLGSPIYISPERLRGSDEVDQRTDIYSLGATFFHLVTGKIPYEGSSPVIMAGHLSDPVPNPHDIEPAIDERISGIIMKMMAKKPEERFQTMDEVCAALQAYKLSSSQPALPLISNAGEKVSSRGWIMSVAIWSALVLIALGYFFWQRTTQREPPAAAIPVTLPVASKPAVEAPPVVPRPAIAPVVVANFNEEHRQNNLNGNFGAWNSGGRDPVGRCSERVEPGAGPDNSACWRVQCGISTPGTFGGTWMDLNRLDGSPYTTLSFKAKTDVPVLNFSAECKTKPGSTQIVSKQIIVRANQNWQTIEIPLKSFKLPSLQALDQFLFIFNQETTGPKDAVLWVDDIVLK